MSSKFIIGFVSGAYLATHYDLKPYFEQAEEKIKKQLEEIKPKSSDNKDSIIKKFFSKKE